MEEAELPVIGVQVNPCCKVCPKKLRSALLEIDGVYKVDFYPGYKKIRIRSTLDPIMIVKEIAKMNKSAELVYYDKEPALGDHHKNAKSSGGKSPRADEHKQETGTKGKENCYSCQEHHDTRDKEDGHFEDDSGYCSEGNGRNCHNHHDPHKNANDDETSDRYRTRNVRENDQERFSSYCNYDFPDNARGKNGPKKHSRCRNYDRHHESCEDEKIPKTFFDHDADMFKEFSDRRRGNSWDNGMPSTDDPMFSHQFRSRTGRYDYFPNEHRHPPRYAQFGPAMRRPPEQFDPRMPSYEQFGPTMQHPPEQFDPRMPSYEQFGPRMPSYEQFGPTMASSYEHYDPSMQPPWPPRASPYYSDFSEENSNSCAIM